MFVYGGDLACDDSGVDDTWLLDLETRTWSEVSPKDGLHPTDGHATGDYDAATKLVFLRIAPTSLGSGCVTKSSSFLTSACRRVVESGMAR